MGLNYIILDHLSILLVSYSRFGKINLRPTISVKP